MTFPYQFAGGMADASWYSRMPDNVLSETIPTGRFSSPTNAGVMASGRITYWSVPVANGMKPTHLAFLSSSTALAGGNNQWGILISKDGAVLGLTDDEGSSAWGSNTLKGFAMNTDWLNGPGFTYTGMAYMGLMVNATTVPTMAAVGYSGTMSGWTPKIAGADATRTGMTTPATAPSTAVTQANITASGQIVYAQLRSAPV